VQTHKTVVTTEQTPAMKPVSNNNRGFSIIEVLVATAVLSISLIAVVAIIRTGTDIQVSVQHRQAARLILTSRLEERYGAGTFNMIAATDGDEKKYDILIDQRGENPLTGTLLTNIRDSTITPASGYASIPLRRVTLSLVWEETPNDSDRLSITRWVVE
jgi:prepilin-type N-terminal cleavage/methylation domain-containing protein